MNPALPFFPIHHAVHRLNDPDEFAVAISGGHLTADFLAKQECPTVIEQFQTPLWALDVQNANVKAHIHCPLPPGWVSVGLMRGPVLSSWYGHEAGEGVLMCNPPGTAIDGCITPGFRCLTLSIPVSAWENCRALAGHDANGLDEVTAVRLPAAIYHRIEQRLAELMPLLRTVVAEPGHSHFTAHEVSAMITEIITTAWEVSSGAPPPPASHRNRTRLAHRAEDWMRAHLAEPFQVPEVCLALGASRRELEYAFRLTFGESPRDFIQALRLNAIRRSLRHTDSGVSLMDAAFDHGIMHLGRFAANYRKLFGENPSSARKGKSRKS